MKKITVYALGLILLVLVAVSTAENTSPVQPADSGQATESKTIESRKSERIIVSYLHMNRRCATCGKLETYTQEAISTGFSEQLKDSSIVWRTVNFEEEGNEHLAKDYQLYSQALILSRQLDGTETEWKNLDKIWQLVGDKDEFTTYVQTELRKFISPVEEK